MLETRIKKKLRTLMIISLCIVVLLGIYGLGFSGLVFKSMEKSTNEQLKDEVTYYKGRINRQITKDFELLDTIATIIADTNIDNSDDFLKTLKEIDQNNNFISLSYFDLNLRGYTSVEEGDLIYIRDLVTTNQITQDTYYKVIDGIRTISNTFIGAYRDYEVFNIGVPVYKNKEVVGALIAMDTFEVFCDEIYNDTVLYGYGHLHLLDGDGNYLIDGKKVVDDATTIFREPYLDEKEIELVKEKMDHKEEVYFEFNTNNEYYQVILEPLGFNGWYLACINSISMLNQDILNLGYISILFFIIITIVLISILFYIYNILKKSNDELRQLAYYDRLTKIDNLYYFLAKAKEKITFNNKYAIVVLNIKHFKYINEIFGRKVADNLLKHVAYILKKHIRYDELVCRKSSDIFYLYLNDIDEAIIKARLDAISKEISEESNIYKTNYQLVVRYGVAISHNDNSLETTMNHAMFAMAKNKENNNTTIWYFDSRLHEQEKMDNYIESHAKEGIEKNEFKLYLQPKVSLKDNQLCAAETLVRWIMDDGTMVYPGSFISLFERNGFIIKLDLYMFEETCKLLRKWLDEGIEIVPISINQSKQTFLERDYINKLKLILDKYQINAKYITLEILESLAIDNINELNIRLDKLKSIGFSISLDDFGTGYSSLNALAKLNVDEIKIDRSFLLETINNKNNRQRLLIKEIISLSTKLGMQTVVEGIETKNDYDFVKEIGSDIGQGYYFDKPLSALEFTDRLKKGKYYD